jgi:hypothetical protein
MDRIPKEEILKWLEKLKKEMKNVRILNEKGKEALENVKAYMYDSNHFLKENNLFLALEAAIWAWAWFKISKELKLIE